MGCSNKLSKMDAVVSWTSIPGMLKNANFEIPYIKFLPRYRDSENVKKLLARKLQNIPIIDAQAIDKNKGMLTNKNRE